MEVAEQPYNAGTSVGSDLLVNANNLMRLPIGMILGTPLNNDFMGYIALENVQLYRVQTKTGVAKIFVLCA